MSETQRLLDQIRADRLADMRRGLRIVAEIDDQQRLHVPMLATDSHRPHATADQGDANRRREQAYFDWIERQSTAWQQRDPLSGQDRDDTHDTRKPKAAPSDARMTRSPEEVERVRTAAWEQMRDALEARWRNP